MTTEPVSYRLDVEVEDVLHVRGQLVHHCEVTEDAGAVSDDDGPDAGGRQDAEPRHAVRLWTWRDSCFVKNA
jgi:hypothetical protein